MIKSLIVVISLIYSTTVLAQQPDAKIKAAQDTSLVPSKETMLSDLDCITLHGSSNRRAIFLDCWNRVITGTISVDAMYNEMAKQRVYVWDVDIVRCTGNNFIRLKKDLQNKVDAYIASKRN